MAGMLLRVSLLLRPCQAMNFALPPAPGGMPVSEDDIAGMLWDGQELSQEAASYVFPKDKKPSHVFSMPQSAAQKLVLMGPMDSGTHLMSWLLTQNYRGHMDVACGMTYQGCRYLWKHSADVPGVYRVLNQTIGEDLSSTVVVAMVRSPIAQVVGWRKDPWDLKGCVARPWAEMDDRCQAHLCASTPEAHDGLAPPDAPSMDFFSTMGVFNQYVKLYKTLRADGKLRDVLIVPYEDLVLAPETVLHRVVESLGWGATWDAALPQAHEQGMKGSHGNSRQEAIARIQARDFLKEARAGLPVLCRHLNQTLLQGIQEGSWAASNPSLDASVIRPYTFDCRNQKMLQ